MVDQIELHDSRVIVSAEADRVVLRFCSAYVHHWDQTSSGWRGEGRSQSAEVVIDGGSGVQPGGPFEVSDGWLEIGSNRHRNLIPVPLAERATVRMQIELVGTEPLVLSGHAVAVRLVGDRRYVEELPTEWAPA